MTQTQKILTDIRQDEKGRWKIELVMSKGALAAALGDLPRDGMAVVVTWSVEQFTPVTKVGQ